MGSVLRVELKHKNGKSKTVEAICVTGNFALHYDLDGTGLMRVTHRPTGMCFPALFESEKFARLFMELLASRPNLWVTKNPHQIIDNFRYLSVVAVAEK